MGETSRLKSLLKEPLVHFLGDLFSRLSELDNSLSGRLICRLARRLLVSSDFLLLLFCMSILLCHR